VSVPLPATSRTSLLGKVALVTGGAVGIGRAVALALAASGADVAITYHTHNGDEMAKEIAQVGRRAEAFRADMRRSADADATVEAVHRELGMIDVLVANAGGLIGRVPLASMSNEHWHDVLDTNLSSAFYVIRAALAHMNDDARIVLISSMAANTGGSAGAGAYAAAKAGMIGLSRALATIARLPVGRAGRPEDVASLVTYLASEATDFLTGEVINLSGGQELT
jgi:3-oxoacyl-[acyl-carrier protein] reductase